MWWVNLVRKVEWKWKSWKLRKVCRELRLMIQLSGKKMRRAIRRAQAGLRRLARFHIRLITWRDLKRKEKKQTKKRGMPVPVDLSSSSITSSSSSSSSSPASVHKKKPHQKLETDGFHEGFDDLDVVSLEALSNYRKWLDDHHSVLDSSSSLSSSDESPEPSSPVCHWSKYGTSSPIQIETGVRHSRHHTQGRSRRSRGRRSRLLHNKNTSPNHLGYSEQQQSCHRTALLDFLFEDSTPPSRFLTSQALQNILGCPKCREIVPILPLDICTSQSCRPCEQCLGYSQTGKCLLCECSYGETKSLLLEKLTMRSWLRPCRYQSYGCQSLVGIEASEDGEHNEEECEFRPLHCPFMLCRRRFPMVSLIKHLHSQHHLYPHDGPKSEGNIICLPSNKRHRGARANYTLDPCAVSCYGNIFILRILRHSTSWYIWVWACRQDDVKSEDVSGHGAERFPYTIRFRHPASRSQCSADAVPPVLTLSGFTVSVRLSMEEIMERGLCQILPEQGSLFDCPEENDSIVVDFALVIHPSVVIPKTHRLKSHKLRPMSHP